MQGKKGEYGFQFLYGTIKSANEKAGKGWQKYFNSSMVQLKG